MLIATTMHATAITKITTSPFVLRRATSWRSKKFMRASSRAQSELDLRRLALLGRFGRLQELRGTEVEHAREEVARERLALGVVFHHRVVERLAREGDLVLGAGQLLLHLQDVLVRLEVRVGLEHRSHAPEP